MTPPPSPDAGDIPVRVFYRIVWTNPALLKDVQPVPGVGVQLRPEYEALATGISVFRTFNQARRTAADRPPWMGRGYIAAITLPEAGDFRIERTTSSRGHYTLCADPDDILTWIDNVVPVTVEKGKTI